MWYFCKYKDALGKPNEGLHSYRVFNISIIDVLLTILLAKFIQYYNGETEFSIILFMLHSRYNNSSNILCKNTNR